MPEPDIVWNLLSVIINNVLEAVLQRFESARAYCRSIFMMAKRNIVHVMKAAGLLATIAFAGASLYYAKAAADVATRQLYMSQLQYCEAQANKTIPCKSLLEAGLAELVLQSVPPTRQELIISVFGPYLLFCEYRGSTSECYQPWWYQWGPVYSKRLRPIFWRFPDVYWISEHIRAASALLSVGCAALLAANYGRGWLNRVFTVVSVACTFVLILFSWWLLRAESGRQERQWRGMSSCLLEYQADSRWVALAPCWRTEAYEDWMARVILEFQGSRIWYSVVRASTSFKFFLLRVTFFPVRVGFSVARKVGIWDVGVATRKSDYTPRIKDSPQQFDTCWRPDEPWADGAVFLELDGGGCGSVKTAGEVEIDALTQLLKNGPAIRWRCSLGSKMLLSLAAVGGHSTIVGLLLENGVNVDSTTWGGSTPLSIASARGHEHVIKRLLEGGASVESKDRYGRTPLSLASGHGHEGAARLLLEEGAEIESVDVSFQTPLLRAAEQGQESTLRTLLRHGAAIEPKDKNGRTPLQLACQSGQVAVVRLLLENGASIESQDRYGRTPLQLASQRGYTATVEMLLKSRAWIESRDISLQTSLSLAAEQGKEAVVEALHGDGADIESKDTYGRTPLLVASGGGHAGTVRLLLELGGAIDSEDVFGRTPLSVATERGHQAVLEVLESFTRPKVMS